MGTRLLEVQIRRHGRKEEAFDVTADPADTIALRAFLKDWLESHKWAESRWGEFELTAFDAGTWTRVARIRMGG